MKINLIVSVLVSITAFVGCTDKTSHVTTSIFENSSGHSLQVLEYKNGQVNDFRKFSLAKEESKEVLVDADAGKGPGLLYPTAISDSDSVVVIYDNSRKAVHYSYTMVGNNLKAIMIANPRSVYRKENYTEKIILEEKKKSEREYKYTFTEQDYLNAQ